MPRKTKKTRKPREPKKEKKKSGAIIVVKGYTRRNPKYKGR